MLVDLFNLGVGHVQLSDGEQRLTLERGLFLPPILDLLLFLLDLLLAVFKEGVLGRTRRTEAQRHHDGYKDGRSG